MILSICVISLYCNTKHLFETWKYLYKSGSSDNKSIDSQHFGTCDSHTDFKVKRSKSRGGGILWRPPSRTACFIIIYIYVNHLMGTGNYSAHRIIWSWYTGRWWVGGLLHLVQRRGAWAPSPLFAVPNVTAHPSTASVPTSYYSMCTIIPCAH